MTLSNASGASAEIPSEPITTMATSSPTITVASNSGMLSRPGISAETLRPAGIRVSDTPEPGSLEIPYHDLHGKPTGFCRWRLPRERADGQKYHQESGTGTRAYIPPQFHVLPPGGDLVLVEGEFKALALVEGGIKAIGLPSFTAYTRDDNDKRQLLDGIAEAIKHTRPDRILFLGDSDTAANYEFARNAIFLSNALKPLPVLLPRLPVGGPGKGIDDCRQVLGADFLSFWTGLVETAERIDPKTSVGSLAARLLEREGQGCKASKGVEREKLTRHVLQLAAKCNKEPLAEDRVLQFAATQLGFSRASLKKALKSAQAELISDAKQRADSRSICNELSENNAAAVGEVKTNNSADLFPIPPAVPWADAVDGAALLNELIALLNRYLVLVPHAVEALALFILTTYAQDCFDAAPYVNLCSPEKRCGKSLTLRLLGLLCDRALPTANCSEASVFRALDSTRPTLLIDEIDTFFADKPQLRGILNAGNIRVDAVVMRSIEVRQGGVTDFEVRRFSVFGPKVFSGIGKLAETLADRSIVVPMRRKRPDESRTRFLRRGFPAEPLRQQCRRWANDHADALTACRPGLPTELNDRAADLWEPLLAVAEIAGGNWPELARAAAIALSGDNPDRQPASLGERLLGDIHKVFVQAGTDHLSSVELCARLSDMEETPWAEIRRGQPINPRKLANLLKAFGVSSRKIRITSTATAQGYDRQDFEDAWERYLPSFSAGTKWNNGTSLVGVDENPLLEAEQALPLFHHEKSTALNEDNRCSTVPLPKPELVEEVI